MFEIGHADFLVRIIECGYSIMKNWNTNPGNPNPRCWEFAKESETADFFGGLSSLVIGTDCLFICVGQNLSTSGLGQQQHPLNPLSSDKFHRNINEGDFHFLKYLSYQELTMRMGGKDYMHSFFLFCLFRYNIMFISCAVLKVTQYFR